MNRAELRRKKRETEKKQVRYSYTGEQLEKMMQEEREKACEFAFLYMINFSILALRDEYDFGKKRMERFIEKVFESYRCFDKDYIEVDDIRDMILEEVGIDIVLKGMTELAK